MPQALEALQFVSAETQRMRRSLRRAEPTPREGCEMGLLLLQRVADHLLRKETR